MVSPPGEFITRSPLAAQSSMTSKFKIGDFVQVLIYKTSLWGIVLAGPDQRADGLVDVFVTLEEGKMETFLVFQDMLTVFSSKS